ncbi:MAG: radical SAM protein [Candidatus Omnitrophica bacterium]|nr:radical SAM protein [Candidatus Omnitrophota bacterium]
MEERFIGSAALQKIPLWDRMKKERDIISFSVELTARCNNNCRHCYINLPSGDRYAETKELPLEKIENIADQAISMGAVWCLLTGGEPLLRKDFAEIYLSLKKKGLLVSVFTNAVLINSEHIKLFKRYPPRDIEVTVYGVTGKTYEDVTGKPGSFDAFMNGLNLLLENGIKVRFKAMALRSNVHELPQISRFCRERTKDYFRFDPFLNLRFDRNALRNDEIKRERLLPQEIADIEEADGERYHVLEDNCDKLINPEFSNINCSHLFHCGAGNGSFSVSYDGHFRLCSSLCNSGCVYDLKSGSLADAWRTFVPKVRDKRSNEKEFLEKCRKCDIINLCMWCPAHADLETGRMDAVVDYFCEVARARAAMLKEPSACG